MSMRNRKRELAGVMVVFDDEQGVCAPMGWDAECPGALCSAGVLPAVLFPSRKEARAAIKVSVAFARLCQAQGRPVNEDFTVGLKCVRLRPVEAA